jgi:hypothetical protein
VAKERRIFNSCKMIETEQQRLWLSNFENLCPYLKFNIDEPVLELKKYLENPPKDRLENGNMWKTEKEFFGYPYLVETINFFWEKILWQPIWYLNAIEQIPKMSTDEDVKRKFELIHPEIELAKDRINEWNFKLVIDIQEKIRINKEGAEQLFYKILMAYTAELELIWDINSAYHFRFEESPVFISFYERINKIRQYYATINANVRFQIFDEYIETLPELKKKFDFWNLKQENESPGDQLTGFSCNLNPDMVKEVYPKLIEKGYLDAEKSNFEALFNTKTVPDNFKPVIWKKISTRNKDINKKSLVDLLRIAGVKDIDIVKINLLFAHPKGGSINIQSSNIFNNKGNENSEFYYELKSFFSIS